MSLNSLCSTNQFMREAIQVLLERVKAGNDVDKVKKEIASKFKLEKIPTNIEILNELTQEERKQYASWFVTKPSRTISGVIPLAVMSAPFGCKHGKCIFCPGGPDSIFGNVPQSYTGYEPSTMRAIRANYDPYQIIFNRLEQYIVIGRIPQKGEVIVQGGTFPSMPKEYKEEFITYIYKALNDFSEVFFKNGELDFEKFKTFFELPGDIHNEERAERVREKIMALRKTGILEKEQRKNERAFIRCVGLTIETKPDWGRKEHGNELLRLGCTRIEIGVQSTFQEVLEKLNRGHTVQDTIRSIRELKDLGFKINAHMMLGLPNSSPEKDLGSLKELFSNPDFCPDMLKIYPCLVMKGTPLFQLWKRGLYKEITAEEAANTIAEAKRFMPKYVRIMRVQRDIPSTVIDAGPIKTNLRQEVEKICKKKGIECQCIRCRESGRHEAIEKITINEYKYEASQGTEYFIAAEDTKNNILVGYCRMRFPSQSLHQEITEKTAIVRELHVYSDTLPLGEKSEKSLQHRGFGRKLMEKAEQIAKEQGKDKIVVISAVGTHEYYKKVGYEKEGVYMVKQV
ncbi:tRNA uridine(34) 5-carboxymethylaminomethyl modification radical SAM/GNAT enzyme Elp3 [Candidatus Woesearchaeota archaeon]|nr:tRNA uridine(34) 5-carboxymethylaminomethyl modification radical SAM/GNAT enzyme Elp3 [Candidatus Woesearchaeota archaeon]